MVAALARRGPDAEGIDLWSDATLGHRRLSIFDLSEAGRQPMVSPDRAVAVVFNGAIYNFHDLRADLMSRGCQFHSQTDTEVLIHGYREWGIDALVAKLRGMFAFGLWDDRAHRLFLVRDRLGVKPLLYAAHNGQLAFASSVRALRSAGFAAEIDDRAVAEYLEFGYVTDDRTIYREAAKVPAATIVEWSGGEISRRQYWTPPEPGEGPGPSFDEALEETERLFLRAVQMRLQADVPVGSLLSSGIDSALICWAIGRLGADITAFTVGAPGDPWDETAAATATARALSVPHRVIPLSPSDSPDVTEMTTAFGEPFACASALGMLRVSWAVKSAATVLLTGDGGDDVFLGYPEHRHLWMAQKVSRSMPSAVAGAWNSWQDRVPRNGLLRRPAHFLDYASGGLGAVAWVHDGLPMYRRAGMLGDRLASATVVQRAIPWSHTSARRVLAEFLAYDRQTRFVGEYLTKVDGATMHYALEARSPMLDQELWEFASSLPFEVRLRRGRLKAVLRELARRRIGPEVARRRKQGFGIPVQRWIAGKWRSAVEEAFHNSLLEKEGWVCSAPMLEELRKAAERRWAPNQLWYLYVLESWLRRERTEPVPALA